MEEETIKATAYKMKRKEKMRRIEISTEMSCLMTTLFS